ncbi:MAG TPA: type II toxin-antitoxin system HicA family toxin [Ktedonobacterales bacterium]|jgi:hypothetical protein
MPRKLRQLRADMRREGARVVHQAGSHEKWRHDLVPEYRVELAGKDGDDAKAYQEREVAELLRRIREARARQKGTQP